MNEATRLNVIIENDHRLILHLNLWLDRIQRILTHCNEMIRKMMDDEPKPHRIGISYEVSYKACGGQLARTYKTVGLPYYDYISQNFVDSFANNIFKDCYQHIDEYTGDFYNVRLRVKLTYNKDEDPIDVSPLETIIGTLDKEKEV